MNNQNYIKAAVELADGWQCHSSLVIISAPLQNTEIEDLSRCHLDTLAAQLARQVDTLDHLIVITSEDTYIYDHGDVTKLLAHTEGGGFTTNTIKAIVDSEVLKE